MLKNGILIYLLWYKIFGKCVPIHLWVHSAYIAHCTALHIFIYTIYLPRFFHFNWKSQKRRKINILHKFVLWMLCNLQPAWYLFMKDFLSAGVLSLFTTFSFLTSKDIFDFFFVSNFLLCVQKYSISKSNIWTNVKVFSVFRKSHDRRYGYLWMSLCVNYLILILFRNWCILYRKCKISNNKMHCNIYCIVVNSCVHSYCYIDGLLEHFSFSYIMITS